MKIVSLSFSKVDSLDLLDIREVALIFNRYAFDQETGFGFSGTEISQNYLTSTLLRQTPVFIPQLDIRTGEFEDQKIFLYSKIVFGIDFELQVLDVKGQLSNAGKVRSILKQVIERRVSISASPILLAEFMEKLEQHPVKVSINSLTIDNFKHGEGMVGKYSLGVIDPAIASHAIGIYTTDVAKMSMSILSSPVGEFTLDIARTGSIKVACHESEQDRIVHFLKQVIYS